MVCKAAGTLRWLWRTRSSAFYARLVRPTSLIIGGVVLLVGYCLFALVHAITSPLLRQIDIAMTPIPTPIQIKSQLQRDWGRSPTVEEASAVYQMISSQRNGATVFVDNRDSRGR
jgi:hypothetical protein